VSYLPDEEYAKLTPAEKEIHLRTIANALREFKPSEDYLRALLADEDCPPNLRAMAEHYLKH
jgi:hypothetical protein